MHQALCSALWEKPTMCQELHSAFCVPDTMLGTLKGPHPSITSSEVMVKPMAQTSYQRKRNSEREALSREPRIHLEVKVTIKGDKFLGKVKGFSPSDDPIQ